jgi:hypothetical protein
MTHINNPLRSGRHAQDRGQFCAVNRLVGVEGVHDVAEGHSDVDLHTTNAGRFIQAAARTLRDFD